MSRYDLTFNLSNYRMSIEEYRTMRPRLCIDEIKRPHFVNWHNYFSVNYQSCLVVLRIAINRLVFIFLRIFSLRETTIYTRCITICGFYYG